MGYGLRRDPVTAAPAQPFRKSPMEPAIAPRPAIVNMVPVPAQPRKSLSELVAENIKLIFAISAALFVGGILLYYRNEIYHGLKQPVIQALILGFVTIGSIVVGWTLVRRTHRTLSGQTLTFVG